MLSVSALNRLARETLETAIPLLWVGGEISNLSRAPSGHIYFTLKDAQAQVRCAMWRNRAQLLAFRPENGMRVEARALVTLYEVRGDYQLNVEALRPAGQGDLFEAFLRLKERLAAEGLFDAAAKRALPRYPRGIGVVTSPGAAALRDVLAAVRRRAPSLRVVLYPSPVQGEGAAAALLRALQTAAARAADDRIDTLLLVRGGGSIEDLQAFNDEALARALRTCPLPVVCGVGHESDFTIADFAADVRAATPTGAAELATAGLHEARIELPALQAALQRAMQRRLDTLAQRLDRAALRLTHPRQRLQHTAQRIDALQHRLAHAMRRRIDGDRHRMRLFALRLQVRRPDLAGAAQRCGQAGSRLVRAMQALLQARSERLASAAAGLQHLAPRAVLARGYSITRDASGRILRSPHAVQAGDAIGIELAEGHIDATVMKTCEDRPGDVLSSPSAPD